MTQYGMIMQLYDVNKQSLSERCMKPLETSALVNLWDRRCTYEDTLYKALHMKFQDSS